MDKSKGIFILGDEVPYPVDPTLTAAIAAYYLHLNFVYTADGISDEWDSHLPAVMAGDVWGGDCDDFAFTAAEALVAGGIPRGDIFLVTVTGWLKALENQALHRNHPLAATADHIVVLFWVEGKWRVLDNRTPGIPLAETLFTGESDSEYFPQGIINISNYGLGSDNDTEAGFIRFWFD